MALNKQAGDMYGFVSHTWNAIKGKCMHDCCYCYMKRFPQKPLWFDEKELKTDLGTGNFIFVGSSTDMFADNVQSEWIRKVLDYCRTFNNTYLFQSKNPERFKEFLDLFPANSILGTTLETNDKEAIKSNAPIPWSRSISMISLNWPRKMITIEPIADFSDSLIDWIKMIKPEFVNIGADSNMKRDYSFPEPSKEKVLKLAEELGKFTEVRNKRNLSRLLK
jgi:hypothetical protein